uniref:Putative secreted protein n=1 Tax=Anopheles marajoara TaxID=58244 RepID=A0A2M4CDR9_9DIPT
MRASSVSTSSRSSLLVTSMWFSSLVAASKRPRSVPTSARCDSSPSRRVLVVCANSSSSARTRFFSRSSASAAGPRR